MQICCTVINEHRLAGSGLGTKGYDVSIIILEIEEDLVVSFRYVDGRVEPVTSHDQIEFDRIKARVGGQASVLTVALESLILRHQQSRMRR